MLVWDRNINGIIDDSMELLGNNSLLANGDKAGNNFAALEEFDTNHDGKIDASDQRFSKLRIWKDLNGDGLSQPDELFSLEDTGVASLNIGYTASGGVDANGNEHRQTGSFNRTDGTTGQMNDVWFKTDPTEQGHRQQGNIGVT